MASTKGAPMPWDQANILWNSNPYTWNDVFFILEVLGGGGLEYLEKDLEKKKRFIQLLCKVQGEEYIEKKEVKETKIFIKDLALVAKEVAGIDLKIEL